MVTKNNLKTKYNTINYYFMQNIIFDKIDSDDYGVVDKLNTSLIYGEVSHQDILKILSEIIINEQNFLDIGSGCGKLVIFIALNLNIYSDGIEIAQNRYQKSLKYLERFDLYDKINFWQESFEEIYFGNYDILYCCNLVFEDEDNKKLYKKIINEFTGKFILLDYDNTLLQYLWKTYQVKCSWAKKVNIFVFYKY